MANKTKVQLLEDINELEKALNDSYVERERVERYECYEACTADIKIFHDKLKEAGFDKVQAFELTKELAPRLYDEYLRDERQKKYYSRPNYPRYR